MILRPSLYPSKWLEPPKIQWDGSSPVCLLQDNWRFLFFKIVPFKIKEVILSPEGKVMNHPIPFYHQHLSPTQDGRTPLQLTVFGMGLQQVISSGGSCQDIYRSNHAKYSQQEKRLQTLADYGWNQHY